MGLYWMKEGMEPVRALKMTSYLSPVIACDQALLEVAFMRDSDLELLSGVRKVLTGEANQKLEEHIAHRVLVELDILNAYERVRAYCLNIAETLAGGKGN